MNPFYKCLLATTLLFGAHQRLEAALVLEVNPINNTLSFSGSQTGVLAPGHILSTADRFNGLFGFGASWGYTSDLTAMSGGTIVIHIDSSSYLLSSLFTVSTQGTLSPGRDPQFTISTLRSDDPSFTSPLDQVVIGFGLVSPDSELEVTLSGTGESIEYDLSAESEALFESSLSALEFIPVNPSESGFPAIQVTVVPEPSAAVLLGACGLGTLARRRRTH